MPVDSTTRSDEQSHVAKLTQKARSSFRRVQPVAGLEGRVAMVPEKTRAVQQLRALNLVWEKEMALQAMTGWQCETMNITTRSKKSFSAY